MADSQENPDRKEIERKLVDEGRLIEAGWIGLRLMALPANACPEQVDELRNAFFAGANHLFRSILHMLDPGEDPTTADVTRMHQIADELAAFIADYKLRHLSTEGRA